MTNTKIEKAVINDLNTEIKKLAMIRYDSLEIALIDGNRVMKKLKQALLTAYQQGKKDRDEEVIKWIEMQETLSEDAITSHNIKTFINQNNELSDKDKDV